MDAILSIVIPVHNRQDYLPRLFRDLEAAMAEVVARIVLVDNGSTDGSLALCRAWQHDSRFAELIEVLEEPTPGANAARNRGLAAVTTPYVYFFDSDDRFDAHFLDAVVPLLSEQREGRGESGTAGKKGAGNESGWAGKKGAGNESGLAGKEASEVDTAAAALIVPTMIQIGRERRKRPYREGADAAFHIASGTLSTQAMVLRTDFLRALGGWNADLSVWQDWELGLRVLLNARRIIWHHARAYHQILIHPDSITGDSVSQNWQGRLRSLQTALHYIYTRAGVHEDAAEDDEQSVLDSGTAGMPISEATAQELSLLDSGTRRLIELICRRAAIMAGHLHREGHHAEAGTVMSSMPARSLMSRFLCLWTRLGLPAAWRLSLM